MRLLPNGLQGPGLPLWATTTLGQQSLSDLTCLLPKCSPAPSASLNPPGFLELPGRRRLLCACDLQLQMSKSFSRLPGKPRLAVAGQGQGQGGLPGYCPMGQLFGFCLQTSPFPL